MVKIKLFNTNIIFNFRKLSKTFLNLWNNTDFYVIVQDVDQPAFAQIFFPLFPLPSPTTILHTVAAQTIKIKQLIIS